MRNRGVLLLRIGRIEPTLRRLEATRQFQPARRQTSATTAHGTDQRRLFCGLLLARTERPVGRGSPRGDCAGRAIQEETRRGRSCLIGMRSSKSVCRTMEPPISSSANFAPGRICPNARKIAHTCAARTTFARLFSEKVETEGIIAGQLIVARVGDDLN